MNMFLIDEETIKQKVKELAQKISKDYENSDNLVVIGVLKGAFIFLADLVRELKIPCKVDFIKVSSYGQSTQSSGIVRIELDTSIDIANSDVLIVEDILDTGLTLKYIKELILSRNPRSLKIAVLLDKVERRKIDISADYVGFVVPDKFLVGYGLDFSENYRNIPYIKELET
ncbi:MAG: hypoxanthine phosphoribosyltransferase [candidate division WOR-3 bacterium]|nr:hypoxanthine phosphoribosyltransferase [candidate division WOR-3 bacterium]MCX7947855.1 hypoxanthine phosphoribosyltransferase [candidate division WOR-3 bacterium]MDW8150677.1 hypoxanthine phosphoribosyltransferase [candidate division WOR-3 bacterium]